MPRKPLPIELTGARVVRLTSDGSRDYFLSNDRAEELRRQGKLEILDGVYSPGSSALNGFHCYFDPRGPFSVPYKEN